MAGKKKPGRFWSSENRPGMARNPTTATRSRAISSWSTKRTASRRRSPGSRSRAMAQTMASPTPSSKTFPAVGNGATEYSTEAPATTTYTVKAPSDTKPRVAPARRIPLESVGATRARATTSRTPRSIVSTTSGLARTSSAPVRVALLWVPSRTSRMARCCRLIRTRPVWMKARNPPGATATISTAQMATAQMNPTHAIPPRGTFMVAVVGRRGPGTGTMAAAGVRGRAVSGRACDESRRLHRARRP